MRKRKKGARLLAVLLALSMAFPLSTQMMEAKAEETDNVSSTGSSAASGTTYEGEKNTLTDAEYAEFGLINNSPAEFDPADTSNPAEGYEPISVSELCVGFMGKYNDWSGRFFVCDDVSTLSSDTLNLDNMGGDTVGAPFVYSGSWYADKKGDVEIQTSNACALDADGDGTDELLHLFLYVNRKENRSAIDLRLVDLTGSENSEGAWVQKGTDTAGDGKIDSKYSTGATVTYLLVDGDSDDTKWVDAIEADATKGLCTAVSGDYDGDGMDEVAVYVPSQVKNEPVVIVYDAIIKADGSLDGLEEKDRIFLNELNTSKNKFNYKFNSWKMPEVALATTSISGHDELVIIGNKPLKESDKYSKYGQTSVMGIFEYDNGFHNVFREELKYGSTRMRFASATDADVNGNGTEELLVGGYLNTEWVKEKDDDGGEGRTGDIDEENNLIQLICWNENTGKYEQVWDEPQKVPTIGDLKVDQEMTEPAALAAGRFLSDKAYDMVFLEGAITNLTGASVAGTTEKERLQSGEFDYEHADTISLGGSHSAFISTAVAGVFSRAGAGCEQLVILAGDHKASNNDTIYYDVIWAWENSRGSLTNSVVNNDYIDGKDEDDNGTFLYIAPANVDHDTMYVTYEGKDYGWSDPALYCVLQSPPYWQELPYNSETFGAGEVAYSISYGTSKGVGGEWGVGLGVHFSFGAVFGPEVLGESWKAGFGFEVDSMVSYVGERVDSSSIASSYENKIAPGEDQVVILSVPIVNYNYKIWYPEHTCTQEDLDAYAEMKEMYPDMEVPDYKLNQVIPGQWVDYSIQETLSPSFSILSVEKYNELAEKYKNEIDLNPITEGTLAEHTIGDPTTYPSSVNELKEPGNVENLLVSDNSVSTQIGESVKSISFEIESEDEKSHGFSVDLDLGLYGKAEGKAKIPLVAAFEAESEFGWTLSGNGGANWLETNTKGLEFSATMSDLPAGSEGYEYSTKLAVYQNSDLHMGALDNYDLQLPDGIDEADGAYVVGYIVTGTDEAGAPPALPQDLRVTGTTDSEVLLKWEPSDYRPADYYEIFIEDNVGQVKSLGVTEENYFIATKLQPSSEYHFAIKAYRKSGPSSVMSRWVSAYTKSTSSSAPVIVEQPMNVIVTPREIISGYAMHCLAERGEGMENATLTYQWQKYSTSSLTGEGKWEDIPGATNWEYVLPVTTEDVDEYEDLTHYRCVATQKYGSDVQSVFSRTATMFINREDYTYHDFGIDITSIEGAVYADREYFAETGADTAYTIRMSLRDKGYDLISGKVPSAGEITVFYRSDQSEGILGKGQIQDGKVSVSVPAGEMTLATGEYELYAVYGGGPDGSQDTKNYYIPSCSDAVSLHMVDVYRINYHLDGGVNSPDNPSVLTNESSAAVLSAPTKNYYTFASWFLDEGCTVPVENNTLDPASLTGDVDVYAKWTPVSYKISYELDGGENSPSNPDSYTIEDTVYLSDPAKEGFEFLGWYTDAEFENGPVDKINGAECSDITLYAKWEEIKVPFDEDEETGAYLISSYQDLVNMAQRIQENPSKYASADYIQTCNIVSYGASWNLPIGTKEHPFEGTYEGYDYYILGLRSDGTSSGLFGVIGENGTVKNLSVVDFDFSEAADVAGGIAGINRGTITGCGSGINVSSGAPIFIDGQAVPVSSLNSDVLGTSFAGGIAGINEGTIINTRSNAIVQADAAGGIAGKNTGVIRNVYNTGSVDAGSSGGGITGQNSGDAVIEYGYMSGSVHASSAGGVAGTSENRNITEFWYLSDIAQACGNLDDASVGAQQKTKDEMRKQAFCDILNESIQGVKEELGLKAWTWSASENNGYPRLERSIVVEKTLTNEALGISVTGMMHPNATLQAVKLDADDSELQAMQASLESGSLLEGWRLALVYDDGTYSTYDGALTVQFTPEFSERLKDFIIIHMDEEGTITSLDTENVGDKVVVNTGSMGSFAVYDASAEASGDEEEPDNGNTAAEPSDNGGDNAEKPSGTAGDGEDGAVSTGDSGTPVLPLCMMIVSCGVIAAVIIKKRKDRQA